MQVLNHYGISILKIFHSLVIVLYSPQHQSTHKVGKKLPRHRCGYFYRREVNYLVTVFIRRVIISAIMCALKQVFTYDSLVHAVSGAAGSVVAMTLFYPLDTARTRLQVDEYRQSKHSPVVLAEIVNEEGVLALYRGWFPVVSTLCCSNFVYFYAFNSLKAVYLGHLEKSDPLHDLTFAFVAGVVNVLVTTPLWVVNTRLKLQGAKMRSEEHNKNAVRYNGILDALVKIIRTEGISTLWNGTKPSIILAANPAIHFMVYEAMKRYFQRTLRTEELSGFLYFIIGACAKTVATIITYPLQVIQSRSRAGVSKQRSNGIFSSLMAIVRMTGFLSLYKGMEAKLIQTVLTAALMFVAYEKIAAFTFKMMGREFVAKR